MPYESFEGGGSPVALLPGAVLALVPDGQLGWADPSSAGVGLKVNGMVYPLGLPLANTHQQAAPAYTSTFSRIIATLNPGVGAAAQGYALGGSTAGMFAGPLLADPSPRPAFARVARIDFAWRLAAAGTDLDAGGGFWFVTNVSTFAYPGNWAANALPGVALVGDGAGGFRFQTRRLLAGALTSDVAAVLPVDPATAFVNVSVRCRFASETAPAVIRILVNGVVVASVDFVADAADLPAPGAPSPFWRLAIQAGEVVGSHVMFFDNLIAYQGDEQLFT